MHQFELSAEFGWVFFLLCVAVHKRIPEIFTSHRTLYVIALFDDRVFLRVFNQKLQSLMKWHRHRQRNTRQRWQKQRTASSWLRWMPSCDIVCTKCIYHTFRFVSRYLNNNFIIIHTSMEKSITMANWRHEVIISLWNWASVVCFSYQYLLIFPWKNVLNVKNGESNKNVRRERTMENIQRMQRRLFYVICTWNSHFSTNDEGEVVIRRRCRIRCRVCLPFIYFVLYQHRKTTELKGENFTRLELYVFYDFRRLSESQSQLSPSWSALLFWLLEIRLFVGGHECALLVTANEISAVARMIMSHIIVNFSI